MIPMFFCPQCRTELMLNEKILSCKKCNENYPYENEISIFPVFTKHKGFNDNLKKLNNEIKRDGFETAIEKFLIKNPELRSSLTYTKYDRSADSIFHCIGNSNQKCLEIKSELGNKVEILSNIFNQVYSIEIEDDLIEFQKIRFNQRKRNNIIVAKCDLIKLPFSDNFFDLILCNNLLDTISNYYDSSESESQNLLIKELKRVIKPNGKIIFGVENKFGIKLVKNERHEQNEKIRKQGFSYFRTLFKNNELYVRSYWVLPSYKKPYFSGDLKDKLSLKWFINNLDNFIGKQTLSKNKKNLLSLIKKINYIFLEKLVENFIPSFIFCCGKTSFEDTIEDQIKRDTNYENFLMLSRRMKILFILLNRNGEPEKLVTVKRYGSEFPTKLEQLERKFPIMKDPEKKAWMEDWFPGCSLNPLNLNEVTLAINWLINFQNNSKQELINKNDIIEEVLLIKKGLQYVNHGDLNQYYKWLDDYEKFMENNKIYKTGVHGDFWISNILINSKDDKIHVLDWELFREKGNPLLDFLTFLYNLMAMTENEPLETLKKNLSGNGKANKIISNFKLMMEEHFGFNLDFILLLRFYLLKKMIPKEEEMRDIIPKENKSKNEPTLYMKMLEMLTSIDYKKH